LLSKFPFPFVGGQPVHKSAVWPFETLIELCGKEL
jgi:hypothetical protein